MPGPPSASVNTNELPFMVSSSLPSRRSKFPSTQLELLTPTSSSPLPESIARPVTLMLSTSTTSLPFWVWSWTFDEPESSSRKFERFTLSVPWPTVVPASPCCVRSSL